MRLNPRVKEAQRRVPRPDPNDLRGSVDGWDFKTYVLILFRFISEPRCYHQPAGGPGLSFDYAQLPTLRPARQEAVTDCGEGLLITVGTVSTTFAERAPRDEPQRDPGHW